MDEMFPLGTEVCVWEEGFGFQPSDPVEYGWGTIVESKGPYLDKADRCEYNLYRVEMESGEKVLAFHKYFHDASYYFLTKDEFNEAIRKEIKNVDKSIEYFKQQRAKLEKRIRS